MFKKELKAMVTDQDILNAKRIGYIIDIPADLAAEQINSQFAGLDLVSLLTGIESLLVAYTKKPPYKKIVINAAPTPQLVILYLSANYTSQTYGLTLKRTFSYQQSDLVVTHDYMVLPKKARGQGLAKKLLAIWFDQYVKMGVKHIYVHAGLKDGGAVWARMGFKALYKQDVDRILRSAKRKLKGQPELDDIITIYNAYYKKESDGKSFPIRRWADIDLMEPVLKNSNNNWRGWIDLTNPDELRNFKLNVGR